MYFSCSLWLAAAVGSAIMMSSDRQILFTCVQITDRDAMVLQYLSEVHYEFSSEGGVVRLVHRAALGFTGVQLQHYGCFVIQDSAVMLAAKVHDARWHNCACSLTSLFQDSDAPWRIPAF